MQTSGNINIYRAVGTIQILYAVSLLFITFYYLPNLSGEVILPLWLKGIVTYGLLIASGLGILLRKKTLFLSSFYVYPILILRRFDYLYLHITTEKVVSEIEVLRKAIFTNSLFQIICAGLLIYIMHLFMRDSNLEKFKVSKKITLIHSAIGTFIYMVFFRI